MKCLERLKPRFNLIVVLILCLPGPLYSEEISLDAVISEYESLKACKFSEKAIPVPEAGITFSRDCATWILDSGQIHLMAPTSNGIITGLVFEGKGRFKLSIPDPVEVAQFKRFTSEKVSSKLEEVFTKMVLRTSEDLLSGLIEVHQDNHYVENRLAKNRHEEWLKPGMEDANGRIIVGLLNSGDQYLCVDMETKTFGWIKFVFDNLIMEEIQLQKLQKKLEYLELWLSLDQAADRKPTGRPSATRRVPIDILRFDIEADMRDWNMPGSQRRKEKVVFRTVLDFNALVNGDRALQFYLNPFIKVTAVSTVDGTSLPFIREQVRRRPGFLGEDLYDDSLFVALDKPLVKNEERQIVIEYERKMKNNYVSGASWYPRIIGNQYDYHTVDLTVMLNDKYEVMAVGSKKEEDVSNKIKTTVWSIDVPTRHYGFMVGEKFELEHLKLEGVPEVVSFGDESTFTTGNIVKNVAIDVANSLKFYQWFYDVKFPVDTMYATHIHSNHGQAFHGYIHLAGYTFGSEHPGASELFRAHEVAHQMWGHMVGFKTYRDQWLSEAFAEYSAMLFIQTTMPDKDYFDEILKVYTNELIGSLKGAMSKFARPWSVYLSRRYLEKLGPISFGRRASSADLPDGYIMQSYQKGPLILHMLRVLLKSKTGNEDLFRKILQDFLHTYTGKDASTEDFKKIIEKHTGIDWSWFFDQWIHGATIPTYSWRYKLSKRANQEGLFELEVTVRQSDVQPGFKMMVPLQAEMDDGTVKQFVLPIDEPEEVFKLKVSKKPKKVIFNPNYSVLAKMKNL